MHGFSRDEFMALNLHQIDVPSSKELITERMQKLREHGTLRFEVAHFRKDGTILHLEVFAKNIVWGNQTAILSIASDISERKQMEDALRVSLQEKNVLIREIHHRVKNNMQVISSLLQLQSDQINDDSIRLLFKEAKDRIRSMSLVHEKLYSTEHMDTIDLAFFINDLVTNLFRSYGINNNRIQFTLEGKNVTLGIDDAVPLALILNELISNSLKHAFPGERKGKINIRIEEKQGIITIELADNGIGTPANVQINNTKTLGLKIVQALTEQINGSIELARNSGTRFILSFKKK